ncbi:hypothetical protein ScPMuIL_013674 [Solemya velum]
MKVVFLILAVVTTFASAKFLAGGYSDHEVSSDIIEVANFAMTQLRNSQNLGAAPMKIIKAQTQVVNGLNYKLDLEFGSMVCQVVVYKPFRGESELTSQQCSNPSKSKRTGFGAPKTTGTDDQQILSAADFFVTEKNKASNSMFLLQRMSIQNATKQVVEGMLYKMDIKMGYGTCRNNQDNYGATDAECPLQSNPRPRVCHVEIVERVWMTPAYTIKNEKCQNKDVETKNPHLVGHDLCHYGMFAQFKETHNKVYFDSQEEKRRFKIFCQNMVTVKELQENEMGTAVYGATKFADMTEAEFNKYISKPWDVSEWDRMVQARIPEADPPTSFDWRDFGAVTPVKNQGSCGSCWAFSTTGNIEGQWKIKKNKLVSLSEQELVDCDKVDEGCEGGLPSNAYKEIIRLGGLETESKYEYDGKDEKCKFVKQDVKVYINSSVAISKDENEMAAWLAKNGPISIGINANVMQFYFGGISHPWKIFCNPKNIDHGVLIVGYGVKGSTPYWIIKNSWGEDWGEKGYYLVYRGAGVCGLNTMCTSAVID